MLCITNLLVFELELFTDNFFLLVNGFFLLVGELEGRMVFGF